MNSTLGTSTTQPAIFSASEARAAGFIAAPAVVVKHHGIAAGQVLGVFRSLFRSDGKVVFRRQADLAKLAGMSRPTIRKAVKVLVEAGLLVTNQADPRETIQYRATRAGAAVLGEQWLAIPRYALGLPGAARAVYGAIIWRAELSPMGDTCFDGVARLADIAGIPIRSARWGIASLEQEGLLERIEGAPGEPVAVRILCPPAEGGASAPPSNRGRQDVSTTPARCCRQDVSTLERSVSGKKPCKNHKVVPAEKLTKITEADLADDASLAGIFMKSVRIGLIPDSGQSRLRVWTAATHALRVADSPPAMFAWIVSGGHWGHATAGDEDVALDRLRGIGSGN